MTKNWLGIPDTTYYLPNMWSDPRINYKGIDINALDITDTMWERFIGDTEREDYKTFVDYLKANKDDVIELLEIVMANSTTGGDANENFIFSL